MKTRIFFALLASFVFFRHETAAQGTAFTYQGRLTDNGAAANGTYDLQFALHDTNTGGSALAGPVINSSVNVSNGLLATSLDFGTGLFDGSPRWLQVGVRTNGGGAFIPVSPRQRLTPSPYAILAANVPTNSIASSNLQNGAVTSAKIASQAVGPTQLGFQAVGPTHVLSGSISTSQLADNSVTAAKIAPSTTWPGFLGLGSVGPGQIAVEAVSTGQIRDNSIAAVDVVSNTFWQTLGNSDTTPGAHFLGTRDNQPLEFKVNNQRALRLEPNGTSANLLAGFIGNVIQGGIVGGVIAGGGSPAGVNTVAGNFCTVVGGQGNTAAGDCATAIGFRSVANGIAATALGRDVVASGTAATAIGDSVLASDNSLAAGTRAKAFHPGCFVWADTQFGDFTSSGPNQFLIRASGGVGINTIAPAAKLHLYSADNPTTFRIQSAGAPGFGRVEFVSNPQGDVNEWRPGYIQSLDVGGFTGGLGFFVNGTGAGSKFGDVEVMRVVNGNVAVASPAVLSFGAQTRQMLNLFNTDYGIGIQSGTLYSRVDSGAVGFNWYKGGVHSDGQGNPGGGATMMSLTSAGLTVNGVFVSTSDRNAKENFEPVNAREMLAKVAALPISKWNFKQDAGTPHVGPMAQDFHAAFGLGTDDKHIATVDADGVALAAIQGLNQKLEQSLKEKSVEIEQLKNSIEELKRLVLKSAVKEQE